MYFIQFRLHIESVILRTIFYIEPVPIHRQQGVYEKYVSADSEQSGRKYVS